MNKFSKILTGVALAATTATTVTVPAEAHKRARKHYHGQTYYAQKYCRHSSGSTGLIAGGAAGAVLGHSVIGGGILGTAAGAVGGAIAGRAIDRASTAPRRCYYR